MFIYNYYPFCSRAEEKSQACGGNLAHSRSCSGAIYLAERPALHLGHHVAQLQRLQRYSHGGGTSSH